MKKKCSHCKEKKSTKEFHKNSFAVYGLSKWCKNCNIKETQKVRKTPKGLASVKWTGIIFRAENRKGNTPAYENVKLLMTREEFMNWAIPEITRFLKQFPNKTPSVDRKDSFGHYELSNLRIVDRGINSLNRPINKNVFNENKSLVWVSQMSRLFRM